MSCRELITFHSRVPCLPGLAPHHITCAGAAPRVATPAIGGRRQAIDIFKGHGVKSEPGLTERRSTKAVFVPGDFFDRPDAEVGWQAWERDVGAEEEPVMPPDALSCH